MKTTRIKKELFEILRIMGRDQRGLGPEQNQNQHEEVRLATTRMLYLALGIHNHQPVGNPISVFEEAYKQAYSPFLKVLARHPRIKVSMHYSGLLLQWLGEKHPDYTSKLKDLNTKGQIELLTGGFYEPILPAIPDRDKIGQIGKLTKYIEEHFAFTPKGMWITERIWEPHLPYSLSETGIEYTLLDENHFRCAGITKAKSLLGYYVTEEQGFPLAIFPISEKLRHAIPSQSISELFKFFKDFTAEEFAGKNPLLCFADSGEKFGSWHGSYKNLYEKNWLEKFFEKLEDTPWIQVISLSEYRKKFPPAGRLYIPVSSYPEMAEWALQTPFQKSYHQLAKSMKNDMKPFLAGGMWRNFLVKYPEVNYLHKKQLYVSQKVEKVKELEVKTRAQEDLWKGQTNDAYWHGLSGGLYLPHLRSSVYHHLIKSEYLVDMYLHRGGPWLDVEIADYDKDLMDEILISTDKLNLYLSPAQGGQLFELDFKAKACNFQNVVSRREEIYHDHKGKRKDLPFDWYTRYSLTDHFLHPKTTLPNFAKVKYEELGDFIGQLYHFDMERTHEQVSVKLRRDGYVVSGKDRHPIRIEKKVTVPRGSSSFSVEFHLTSSAGRSVDVWFASEFPFSFLSGSDPDSGFLMNGKKTDFSETREFNGISNFSLRDGIHKVEIQAAFSKNAQLWHFPIETNTRTEHGFEQIYQGTVLLPHWKISLGPRGTWKTAITFNFRELP